MMLLSIDAFAIRRSVLGCLVVLALAFGPTPVQADLVTFDELNTWTSTGPKGSYYNGDSGIGSNANGWTSGGVAFGNNYDTSFGGFWSGFGYSNVNDPATPGFMNQYAANQPTGMGGGGNYAIVYAGGDNVFWNFQQPSVAQSIYVTNTAYTMYAMLDGDPFSKKFGGPTGNDPDFFSIRFEGFTGGSGTGSSTGAVDFYLADYRFADNTKDYVIRDWTKVDLRSLGTIQSVVVSFDSSDAGPWGINTPTYAALDNLSLASVPEPSSWLLACVVSSVWLTPRRRSGLGERRGSA